MVYRFKDGFFRFFVAYYGSWAGDKRIIFRVRTDRDPKERAKEKGIIHYDRILEIKENPQYINSWLFSHPGFDILGIKEGV